MHYESFLRRLIPFLVAHQLATLFASLKDNDPDLTRFCRDELIGYRL